MCAARSGRSGSRCPHVEPHAQDPRLAAEGPVSNALPQGRDAEQNCRLFELLEEKEMLCVEVQARDSSNSSDEGVGVGPALLHA